MTEASSITLRTPSGLPIVLSAGEYRLLLLGRADFAGDWDALELATTFVPDGPAKRALIQERLRPLVESLSPAERRVDALELLAARYWFRREMVRADPHGKGSA